jgi:hypothetical protein
MAAQPQTTTPSGYTKADYLTDDQLDQIIEAIANGLDPVQACLDAGTSHSQFRRRCDRDHKVGERAQNARLDGKPELIARARSEFHYHVFERRDYKAVKDFLMVYDPDWEKMRTQRFEVGNIPGQALIVAAQQAFGDLTDAQLEAKIRLLEAQKEDEHKLIELPLKASGE